MKLLQSFMRSDTASTLLRGAQVVAKSQPSHAPVALGGSTIAGVVMMLIGGYKIADCIRYQTAAGQCDQVVENNASAVISGPLILLTGWGGFNTYNKKLREDEAPVILPPRELVEPEPVNPFAFSAPTTDQIVMEHESGKTQEDIAELFGISRYQVRRALKEAKEAFEGKQKDRNKDRGR
jgi:hypothetical protein